MGFLNKKKYDTECDVWFQEKVNRVSAVSVLYVWGEKKSKRKTSYLVITTLIYICICIAGSIATSHIRLMNACILSADQKDDEECRATGTRRIYSAKRTLCAVVFYFFFVSYIILFFFNHNMQQMPSHINRQ